MRKIKLKEVLEIKRGTSLSGKYYSTSGQYIRLTLGNFNYPNGGFKENRSKEDIFFKETVKPQFILKKGDIITPLTEQVMGLLGKTATIPESNKYIQSGDIGLVVPNEEKLDKRFAYYLISSGIIKKQLAVSSQQTKIRHTSPEKIMDCIAWIPEIEEQKKIALLLDNINLKISNNNQINNNLEELMKTLYQRWFIEFNFPNEDGKPYKSSDGKMVYSEEIKQEIPNNWCVETLYNNRLTSFVENGVEYFESKEYLATGDVDGTDIVSSSIIDFETRESRANMQPQENTVWFAKMKNSIKHLYFDDYSKEMIEKYILSTGFCGLKCEPNCLEYIISFINSEYFEIHKDVLAHGATQEAVNNTDLKGIKLIVPSNDILKKFQDEAYSAYEKIYFNKLENQKLTSLRNFLLPMLMNGQINVDDIKI